ncbi:MAG: DJ-1/PfpI family protein, partial [Patescibacteria group bacterium]|nr:DJ-1/PfpI family protein [Patescibacteria group bacterium]
KLLGAICIAPAILARAGALKGKKATVWNSAMDKSAIKILESNGAIFQPEPVVVENKIITANGSHAAEEFAETIIKIINLREQ